MAHPSAKQQRAHSAQEATMAKKAEKVAKAVEVEVAEKAAPKAAPKALPKAAPKVAVKDETAAPAPKPAPAAAPAAKVSKSLPKTVIPKLKRGEKKVADQKVPEIVVGVDDEGWYFFELTSAVGCFLAFEDAVTRDEFLVAFLDIVKADRAKIEELTAKLAAMTAKRPTSPTSPAKAAPAPAPKGKPVK